MSFKKLNLKRSYVAVFSPDGCFLATIGTYVWMWDLNQRKKIWRSHPFKHPSQLAFSPDGKLLAVKNTSGCIALLKTESGELVSEFEDGSRSDGSNICFYSNGQYLINGTWIGVLANHALPHGEVDHEIQLAGEMINSIHVFDASDCLSAFHTLKVDNKAVLDPVKRFSLWGNGFSEIPTFTTNLEFVENGLGDTVAIDAESYLLAHDHRLSHFDLTSHEVLVEFGELYVCHLAVALERRLVAWADNKDCVFLWEMDSGETRLFSSDVKYVSSLDFSPDESRLAIGSWENGAVLPI